jgi:putative ABC transport system ATP-binding protein
VASDSSETLIECRDVSRHFRQGETTIVALDRVSLRIGVGEFVSLSGPSGSGKTTLLNVIGGLDRPDSGEITVEGKRLDQLSRGALASLRLHSIGFVFQAYNLVPVLTAEENVSFVMQVQGMSAAQRRQRAHAILEEVGLDDHATRRPAELSGGQQQRVAVARAIASGPRLVLADEPTANLDTHSAAELMDLFMRLNAEHGITFVIATHDPRVMACTGRRINMVDGRIDTDAAQEPRRMEA